MARRRVTRDLQVFADREVVAVPNFARQTLDVAAATVDGDVGELLLEVIVAASMVGMMVGRDEVLAERAAFLLGRCDELVGIVGVDGGRGFGSLIDQLGSPRHRHPLMVRLELTKYM